MVVPVGIITGEDVGLFSHFGYMQHSVFSEGVLTKKCVCSTLCDNSNFCIFMLEKYTCNHVNLDTEVIAQRYQNNQFSSNKIVFDIFYVGF